MPARNSCRLYYFHHSGDLRIVHKRSHAFYRVTGTHVRLPLQHTCYVEDIAGGREKLDFGLICLLPPNTTAFAVVRKHERFVGLLTHSRI